jgi:hypothetical protein
LVPEYHNADSQAATAAMALASPYPDEF